MKSFLFIFIFIFIFISPFLLSGFNIGVVEVEFIVETRGEVLELILDKRLLVDPLKGREKKSRN